MTTSSITNRALLVTLNVSQWTARKFDRQESRDIRLRHGLDVDAARVNKNLLPMGHSLEMVHKKTSAIRNDYLAKTLPWADGQRIIPCAAYMALAEEQGDQHREWRSLVDDFIRDYPAMQAEAQRSLGSLYKQEDYPDVSELQRKFAIGCSFFPVPDANDWRVDVGEQAVEQLRAQLETQVRQSVGQAMEDAWERVRDLVAKTKEKLADPKGIFRDSLVENAVELCAILPRLNLTGDAELERVRQELERSVVCTSTPDTLRKDPVARSAAVSEMDRIMGQMAGMYGKAA